MLYSKQIPGRTVLIDRHEWLYFSGTGYLGMSQDGTFLSALSEGFSIYGAHFGGSRLSNLRFTVFEEAEAKLARWTGAEAALSVSSGSLAGQLLTKFLWTSGHELYPAPGLHPALWADTAPGAQTMAEWIDKALEKARQPRSDKQPLALLVNSIDPLKVSATDFAWLGELAGNHPIVLVIDDSHGFGVRGTDGGGIFSLLQPPGNVTLLVVSSLGKALGLPGGVIAGSRQWIEACWQSPLFGGASPVSPAFLHAFLQCLPLYASKRAVLLDRVRFFSGMVQTTPMFRSIPDYPVYYTPRNELAAFLAAQQILISSFAYPTPNDSFVTRLVINSAHTAEDIETLANLVLIFAQQNGKL